MAYNITGRATPDVSALGTGYKVYNDGKPLPGGVGGTSASAPAFAGVCVRARMCARGTFAGTIPIINYHPSQDVWCVCARM